MMSFTQIRTRLLSTLALCTVVGTVALAQVQSAPKEDKKDAKPGAAEEKAAPGPAITAAAAVDPNSYKIGADDVLDVRVWKEPDLSGQHRVRPDGKITLPLVGELQASGLTPAELTAKATETFGTILNTPKVIISVIAVQSKKYFVLGEVERSGPFPLVTQTTVLQALSLCGFREWAKKSNIIIMRGDKRLKFNYNQVVKGKNLEQNILLEDGDYIQVP